MKGRNFKVCHVALSLVLLFSLTSCGDKKNSTNSNSTGTSFDNNGNLTGPQYRDGSDYNGQQISQIQGIKSSLGCRQGARLQQDVIFSVQGAVNGTTIGGHFQDQSLPGTVSQIYVGVSYFNDLMFVSKITQGNNVVGYNVRLSLCSMAGGNAYGIQVPYIDDQRPLTNFRAPKGITLQEQTNCGVGLVTSAQDTILTAVAMTIPVNGMSVQAPAVDVPTTFYAPGCR